MQLVEAMEAKNKKYREMRARARGCPIATAMVGSSTMVPLALLGAGLFPSECYDTNSPYAYQQEENYEPKRSTAKRANRNTYYAMQHPPHYFIFF